MAVSLWRNQFWMMVIKASLLHVILLYYKLAQDWFGEIYERIFHFCILLSLSDTKVFHYPTLCMEHMNLVLGNLLFCSLYFCCSFQWMVLDLSFWFVIQLSHWKTHTRLVRAITLTILLVILCGLIQFYMKAL